MNGNFSAQAMRRLLFPAFATSILLTGANASAQEEGDLKLIQAVDSLTQVVQSLSETVAGQARRIGALEDSVRSMTGFIEETGYSLKQIQARINTLETVQTQAPQPETTTLATGATTVTRIIPDPSIAGNPSAGELGVAPPSDDDTVDPSIGTPPPFDDPADQYKYAYSLLSRAQYAEAEKAFETFIRDHPNDSLTDNAYYWLGETYYVRKDYQAAASSFARGYQAAPKEPKAPDMLLKLGLSLIALGRKEDACQTFQRLETDYEDLAPRTVSRLEAGRNQACS